MPSSEDGSAQSGRSLPLEDQARLLELTHDAIVVWEPNGGGIKFWNRAAEDLYGYAPGEALGRVTHDLLNTGHRVSAESFEDELKLAGRWSGELVHRTKDGRHITVESRLVLVVEPDGRTVVLETNRDLTRRKRTERELRESERRYRTLIEQAPVGIAHISLDNRWIMVNDRLSEVLGYTSDELMSLTFSDVTLPEDRANDFDLARRLDAGEITSFRREKRYVRKDGEVRWVEVHVSLAKDDGGGPAHRVAVIQDITDRRRADATLAEREARLSALVDQATAGIAQTDNQGRFLFVNDRFCNLVGRTREELLSMRMQEITHPEDLGSNLVLFRRALEQGEPFEIEKRYLRPDGSIIWVNNSISPVRASDDTPITILAVSVDITERKHAEEAVRAKETRLRLAVEAGQLGEWELDVEANTSVRAYRHDQIFGYEEPVADWGFETFISHVLPADREEVEKAYLKAAEEGAGWHFQCRIRRVNDGRVRWIEAHSEPQLDDAGNVKRVFGIIGDVTEQREPEERIRRLLDQLFAFVGIMEPDGTLIEANRAPLEAAGIAAGDVIGKPFWEAYWWSYDPAVQAQLQEAVSRAAAGEVVRYDVQVRLAGELVTIDFQVSPLRDADGRIAYLIPSGVVVEERVRAEAELRRLNVELEQRVADAVAAVEQAHEALRQSQKLEAVGQLTGGVAHDFNNLLTIIRGSVDLLRRRELPEEKRRRYIDAISDTADRAAKLTSQLLSFARRQALNPELFEVVDRVRAISDMLRTLLGSRIQLKVDVRCADCFVKADAAQFETALVNMAVNARDAMEGEGRLTFNVKKVDRLPPIRDQAAVEGEFVSVAITDSGSGIEPDKLYQIFEPFFTTKPLGKGTGLGLSQVYGFAKQSGGEVDVQSTVGTGTTFTLYLPRARAGAAVVRQPASVPIEEEGRGCILVVEDNEQVGEFATHLLEDLGYETSYAASADQALRLLERNGAAIDLVFTDVVMPGMSGVELASTIRRRWPAIPVVLTSGYSHILAEEPNHGFPLLHKPYSVEKLSAVVSAELNGEPA